MEVHTDKLIDRNKRRELIPYSDTHIDRLEKRGLFPRRLKIGPNRVAWLLSEILAWIEQRRSTIGARDVAQDASRSPASKRKG